MSQYPIELLKKKLGAFYPEDFKEFIIALQPTAKVVFNILGNEYTLLPQLVGADPGTDQFDEIEYVSDMLDEFIQDDPEQIKLPFARSLFQGTKYGYLYFLAEPGSPASPEVYYRDTDRPEHKKLHVAFSLPQVTNSYPNLINLINTTTAASIILTTAYPIVSHFLPPFPLPKNISIPTTDPYRPQHRTFQTQSPENTWKIEFNVKLIKITTDGKVEYFSILSMTSMLLLNGLGLESYICFWIEGEYMQPCLERNHFTTIFYYRLAMVLHAVDDILNHLPESWSKEQVVQLMDQKSLIDICRMSVIQIDYGEY